MSFEEPRVDTRCGFCGCIFGTHYVSFDGDVMGCTTDFGQREGRCTCKGFALVYRPKVRTSAALHRTPPDWGGQGETYDRT